MKVIIAGSRGITDYSIVCAAIGCSGFHVSEVVSGTARGVDRLGERYGTESGKPVAWFPADWGGKGKIAGLLRNEEMADYADALIAVWDGVSRGTDHMIRTMRELGKPVFVYTIPGYQAGSATEGQRK